MQQIVVFWNQFWGLPPQTIIADMVLFVSVSVLVLGAYLLARAEAKKSPALNGNPLSKDFGTLTPSERHRLALKISHERRTRC